jgi:tRNA (guanine-N7-)-methyltransferase
MRVRKKKNGAARIAACSDLLIENVELLKEDPQYAFGEKRPLYIEIGCGKGNFACGKAAANREVNFIAMEKVADVACLALEKAKSRADERPDNLRFIIGDAKNLSEWFPDSCADGIYLNFSDPWPKAGHAKRRLTYRTFLELYRKLLKDGGALVLKTDNVGLFDFSLEEFEACGLEVEWFTRDLHNSEYNEGNVMTEYEANFSSQGFPICSAKVIFRKEVQND